MDEMLVESCMSERTACVESVERKKECDILGVKTYSDPSYIFSGGQDPKPPRSTSLFVTYSKRRTRWYSLLNT